MLLRIQKRVFGQGKMMSRCNVYFWINHLAGPIADGFGKENYDRLGEIGVNFGGESTFFAGW